MLDNDTRESHHSVRTVTELFGRVIVLVVVCSLISTATAGTVAVSAGGATQHAAMSLTTQSSAGDEVLNTSLDTVLAGKTVVGDTLYAATTDGTVNAYSTADGSLLWSASVGGSPTAPKVSGGVVYVGAGDGTVRALDASDGAQLWSTSIGSSVPEPVQLSAEGTVIAASGGTLYSLDTGDGSTVWQTAIGEVTGPYVVANGTVYVGVSGSAFMALSVADGSTVWRHQFADGSLGSVAIGGGNVYWATYGTTHAMDRETGAFVWNASVEPNAVPTYEAGTLYLAVYGGDVIALDATDGSQSWTTTLPDDTSGSLTVAGGTVYAPLQGNVQDTFWALDAGSGAEQWHSSNGFTHSTPLATGGVVYTGAKQVGASTGVLIGYQTAHTDSSSGSRERYGTVGHVGNRFPVDGSSGPVASGTSPVSFILNGSATFRPSRTTLTVATFQGWSTERRRAEGGYRVAIGEDWSRLDTHEFNWNNRTSFELTNGTTYRLTLRSGRGTWVESGYVADVDESPVVLSPGNPPGYDPPEPSDGGGGDVNDGGGSDDGPDWRDYPDYNEDFFGGDDGDEFGGNDSENVTDMPVEGPTYVGPCTTVGGTDGIRVEYWDPNYETTEFAYNFTVENTTYAGTKSFSDPIGYYNQCLGSSVVNGTDEPRTINWTAERNGTTIWGSEGYQPTNLAAYGPVGHAPDSPFGQLALFGSLLGGLAALWYAGRRFAPASEYERLPVSPLFLVGAPALVLLTFEFAGGGLVSFALASALQRVGPLLGLGALGLFGYWFYTSYIESLNVTLPLRRSN